MTVSKAKTVKKLKEKLFNKRKEPPRGDNAVNRDDGVKKLKSEDFKERSSMPTSTKGGTPDLMGYQRAKLRRTDREAKSVLHEENTRLSSQPTPLATNAAAEGGCPTYDVQPCPTEGLRVAMLKSRFSEIIVKSQDTLSNHGKISDPLKIQDKKERFESLQREEINRIKYQMGKIEDAGAATMLQREKEREATRLALRQMTKTVDLYDNIWVQREFDALIGSQDSYHWPQAVC